MEEGKFPNGYSRRRRVTVPAEAIEDGWVCAPVLLGQRDVRFEMPDGTPLTTQVRRGLTWVKVPLLAEDEETAPYVYYDRDAGTADELRRALVYQVETAPGVGPGLSGMLIGPGILSPEAAGEGDIAKLGVDAIKAATFRPFEPAPASFPADPSLLVGGRRFRPRPQPDMTPREGFLLGLFFTIAAHAPGDAGYDAESAVAWLVERNLLRHVEVEG